MALTWTGPSARKVPKKVRYPLDGRDFGVTHMSDGPLLSFFINAVALRLMFLFGIHRSLEQPFLPQDVSGGLFLFLDHTLFDEALQPHLGLSV